MKKIFLAATFILCAGVAVNAAEISKVIVRQQWPWSADVKVEYVVKGIEKPVDISVAAFDGENELSLPRDAVSGDVYGIEQSGVGTIVIDPVKVFGSAAKVSLENFTVRLSVSLSKGDPNEVLYKIFDLDDGSCTDVTRRSLLNGEWGDIETDYKAIDPNFSTTLDNVLVWTGVTNNPVYKTDKLVMRKISAKDVVWQSGDPEDVTVSKAARIDRRWIKLSYDYYIAVFETTQGQFKKIFGSLTKDGTNDGPEYPVNYVPRYYTMGYPNQEPYLSSYGGLVNPKEWVVFPTNSYVRDVGKATFLEKLWKKTGYEFHLPTGAEWEYACRGGNDGVLFSGESQTDANVCKIAVCAENSQAQLHTGGTKAPNAFGVYDMLGNVMEHVNYSGEIHQGATSGSGESAEEPAVDPLGDPAATHQTTYYVVGGGFYNEARYGKWCDCRPACRSRDYERHYQSNTFVGFRVVCPVAKQWAEH